MRRARFRGRGRKWGSGCGGTNEDTPESDTRQDTHSSWSDVRPTPSKPPQSPIPDKPSESLIDPIRNQKDRNRKPKEKQGKGQSTTISQPAPLSILLRPVYEPIEGQTSKGVIPIQQPIHAPIRRTRARTTMRTRIKGKTVNQNTQHDRRTASLAKVVSSLIFFPLSFDFCFVRKYVFW